MHRFKYKEISIEGIMDLFDVKHKNKFMEAVADLLLDDYTENAIKYALTKPNAQKRLYANNKRNIGDILKEEVSKYAFKTNDPRWDERNKNKAQREAAEKIRNNLKVEIKVRSYKPEEATGYIYFIQAVNGGPIKIGYTGNVEKRKTALQVANAYKLEVIGYIEGSVAMENKLHKHLVHAKTYGEWFEPDDIVIDTIKNCLNLGHEYVKTLK